MMPMLTRTPNCIQGLLANGTYADVPPAAEGGVPALKENKV